MQMDAEAGQFDLIHVEALDRLSRKLADVADLHDRLSFLDIGLHTVSTGDVTRHACTSACMAPWRRCI